MDKSAASVAAAILALHSLLVPVSVAMVVFLGLYLARLHGRATFELALLGNLLQTFARP